MGKKQRHNITIKEDIWNMLKEIKINERKQSISSLIEDLAKYYVKNNYNEAYYKLMATAEEISDKEQTQIEKILDSMSKEDLEIGLEEDVEI